MFTRKFIIMSKQALKDVKGHIKLEVRGNKGKISLSVEGVAPKRDIRHKLYLVTDEKHGYKEINLGVININKNGRGKLDLNFNPNSINRSEIGISGFNIFLLKEENIESLEAQVILGGYIHKDDGSMSKVKQKREEKPLENKQVKENKEDKDVKKIKKATEERKAESKEIIKEESKEEAKEEKKSGKADKADKLNKPERIEEAKKPKEVKATKEKDNQESFDPSKSNFKDYYEQLANYTLDLLKFFKETKPFKDDIQNENFTWWEIDQDKLNEQEGFLPYYKYISDPPNKDDLKETDVTCSDQIEKYKKYLFGISQSNEKITHYIYAIPGRHERNEHPHGGKTGFVTWLEDKSKLRDGYWLIYIDAYTGKVVRPV